MLRSVSQSQKFGLSAFFLGDFYGGAELVEALDKHLENLGNLHHHSDSVGESDGVFVIFEHFRSKHFNYKLKYISSNNLKLLIILRNLEKENF